MNGIKQMRAKLEGLSVLIVEDDPVLRKGMKLLCGKFLGNVEEAADAADALERFEARPFNLVVSDLNMPGISGMKLAALLKKRHPELLFVMVTGDSDPEECDDAPIDIMLQKPVMLEDVKSVLELLIARQGR